MKFPKRLLSAVSPARVREAISQRINAAHVRRLPDRIFIEQRIFPWLARDRRTQILSIGCDFYTAGYEALLESHGLRMTTVDILPDRGRYGARRHFTCSVADVTLEMLGAAADGVILNGVVGHGLDGPDEIRRGLQALNGVMKPGAPLVIGWNTDRVEPPPPIVTECGFAPVAGPSGETRVAFPGSTHVYDFVVKSAVIPA